MTRNPFQRSASALLCALSLCAAGHANADVYDAAVANPGRSAADVKRDALDHPAELLRLAGIKPGMRVADVLAGDGYYSELASSIVGPKGKVLMINNAAFDHWSEGPLQARLASDRLANVEHQTLDLNHMNLAPASLDAILLVKVYHDLYWIDPEGVWPKVDTRGVLDQLAHALKPGGILLLVDHSAKARSGCTAAASPLHRHHRRSLRDQGFRIPRFSRSPPKATCCAGRTMRATKIQLQRRRPRQDRSFRAGAAQDRELSGHFGCTIKIERLSGTTLGPGCCCSSVAGGVGPNFAAAM